MHNNKVLTLVLEKTVRISVEQQPPILNAWLARIMSHGTLISIAPLHWENPIERMGQNLLFGPPASTIHILWA